MQAHNVVFPAGHALSADVGTPQVGNLVQPSYQSGSVSDRVAEGRAKSALNSEQVPVIHEVAEAPQERWSRGCRRARVSFWFWQWFRPSPLAPRKKKHRWLSRLRLSRLIPASTSNLAERACLLLQGGPAPTPGLLRGRAVDWPFYPGTTSISHRSLWAVISVSSIRPSNCNCGGHVRC